MIELIFRDFILLLILIFSLISEKKNDKVSFLPIALGSLFAWAITVFNYNGIHILESLFAGISILIIGIILFRVMHPAIHSGFVSLCTMIGFFVGLKYGFLIFILSFVILFFLYIAFYKRKQNDVPVCPALLISSIIVLAYESTIYM